MTMTLLRQSGVRKGKEEGEKKQKYELKQPSVPYAKRQRTMRLCIKSIFLCLVMKYAAASKYATVSSYYA